MAVSDIATVTRLPLRTRAGTMWALPVKPPSRSVVAAAVGGCKRLTHLGGSTCCLCPREGRCREAVWHGDFIGCERALKKELLE